MARESKLGPILTVVLFLGALGLFWWHPFPAAMLALSGLMVFLATRKSPQPHAEEPAPRRYETMAMPSLAAVRPMREPQLETPVASPTPWREQQIAIDQENAQALAGLAAVARQAIKCRSVSIFLPARDGQARLRAWDTAAADFVPGVLAQPGKGLLGLLLKVDGREEIFEPDVPHAGGCDWYQSSTTRSLMAVRFAVGSRLGLIVADDEAANSMIREGLETLANLAQATTLLLERGGRLAREGQQKEIFAKLLEAEKELSQLVDADAVHRRLRQFLSGLLPDGTMLLVRVQEGEGRVVWADGRDATGFEDFPFDVPGRGILSQSLSRGGFLSRKLIPDEHPVLLASGEPELRLAAVGDLLVFPMALGEDPTALALVSPDRSRQPPFLREAVELVAASASQVLGRIQAGRELENLATRDGLTGLVNVRTFKATLDKEILRARRTGQTLALFMTDIDHFKKVNDTHGHPAGDAVLRHVAQVVRSQVRDELDIVARYGGEEFACVLVGASAEAALETAERIRAAVETSPSDIGTGTPLGVTLSLGMALFPADGKERQELVDGADKALYRAKKAGRNRVERALGPG